MLARQPDHAEALHLLGLALAQTGRAGEGVPLIRRSVAAAPDEPSYRRNLGLVLLELGAAGEAAEVLERLLERWPRDAASHSFLGTARTRQGALAAGLAAHERALQFAPGDDRVWSDYGAALLAAGRVEDAIGAQRHALALNPGNALAALNLGNALRDGGDRAGATAAFRQAVERAPALAIAWHNLGVVLGEAGDPAAAAECFAEALRRAPGQPAHAAAFAETCAAFAEGPLPVRLMAPAFACLRDESADTQGLALPFFRALQTDERLGAALAQLARGGEIDLGSLCDERFLLLLERVLVPDAAAEHRLVALRRALLERHARDGYRAVPLLLACAVAAQAFANEYVWPVAAAETALVHALAGGLATASPIDGAERAISLALVAAYRPLADLPLADLPVAEPDAAVPAVRELWRRQVEAVRAERGLREAVPALTPVGLGVSAAVQQHYEENPYPRWRALPSLAGALPLAQKLRALFPWIEPAVRLPESPRVLVAGCGTGLHPIVAARLHPAASILAVDLSRASLAYAIAQARALGVGNVEFAQADILALGALAERFDVIECAGVLHHLADPLAGWRVLVGLLAPGGLMKVALYSQSARAGVVAARALVAACGFAADAEGIRHARQAILALPADAPPRAVVQSRDFWSLSGCRDLLFHVQEHRFTLPEIAAALDRLGLEFLGFEFADPPTLDRYRAARPDDPTARSLDGWAAFEAAQPDAFAGMYQFWVRRS